MIVDVPGIPLRQQGGDLTGYALCSPEDFARLNEWRWCLTGNGYVVRHGRSRSGRTNILMHRVVLGLDASDPMTVDHINGDKLDNRRDNLRVCTHQQNCQNHPGYPSRRRSRFKNVYFDQRRAKPWYAQIHVDGKFHHKGGFATEEEAATAAAALRESVQPFAQRGLEASA